VAETTVRRLLCCGFRSTGKATGQVYQCRWRICPDVKVIFVGLSIIYFTYYTHLCDLFNDSAS
jgi:hypothetical protein